MRAGSRTGPFGAPQGASTLLTIGILAHLIVWTVCVLSPTGHLGDFQRYWDIASTAAKTDIAVPVEYPPGAVLVFDLLAHATGDPATFNVALLLANLAADGLVLVVLVFVWGTGAGAAYLTISAPIISLLFFRFDLWPVAAATAGVACWTRERWRAGAAMIALGVALKLWPLPLVTMLFTGRRRSVTSVLVPLGWLAFGGLAGAAGWFWYSGVDGFLGVLTFRSATGWGIESTIGSVWRIIEPESIRLESGAVRAGRTVPLMSVALFLGSMPVSCWALYRGGVTGRIGSGWVTGLGALLACSALLSPQFLGWLLPGAAIAWTEGDRRTTKWFALLVALTVGYRILHTTQMPILVLLRNVMLIGMVGDGVRLLLRPSASRPSPSEPRQDHPVFRFQAGEPPGA